MGKIGAAALAFAALVTVATTAWGLGPYGAVLAVIVAPVPALMLYLIFQRPRPVTGARPKGVDEVFAVLMTDPNMRRARIGITKPVRIEVRRTMGTGQIAHSVAKTFLDPLSNEAIEAFAKEERRRPGPITWIMEGIGLSQAFGKDMDPLPASATLRAADSDERDLIARLVSGLAVRLREIGHPEIASRIEQRT